ncbi:MAG TPA: hypothetical protein VFG07_05600 [Thermoplasmata archaeon]|nr:hypothetical protein [Thermoplasmata archaeon]
MAAQVFDLALARSRTRRSNRILRVASRGFAAMWVAFALLFLTDLRWTPPMRIGFSAVAAAIAVFFGVVLPRFPVATSRPLVRPVPERLAVNPRGLTLWFEGGRDISRAWDSPGFEVRMFERRPVRPGHTGLSINIYGVGFIPVDRSTFDSLQRVMDSLSFERVEATRAIPPHGASLRTITFRPAGSQDTSERALL